MNLSFVSCGSYPLSHVKCRLHTLKKVVKRARYRVLCSMLLMTSHVCLLLLQHEGGRGGRGECDPSARLAVAVVRHRHRQVLQGTQRCKVSRTCHMSMLLIMYARMGNGVWRKHGVHVAVRPHTWGVTNCCCLNEDVWLMVGCYLFMQYMYDYYDSFAVMAKLLVCIKQPTDYMLW